jgi:hypothetical protein
MPADLGAARGHRPQGRNADARSQGGLRLYSWVRSVHAARTEHMPAPIELRAEQRAGAVVAVGLLVRK